LPVTSQVFGQVVGKVVRGAWCTGIRESVYCVRKRTT
jgi:hypothetical protein